MKSILNYSKILILISVVIIISGLSVIFKYGFNLSIEYTGGSVFEISKEGLNVSETISNLKNFLDEKNIKYKSIDANGGYLAIKLEETDNNKTIEIKNLILDKFKDIKIENIETVGSTYGNEFFKNSILAIIISLLGIVALITYSFWNIPNKYYSYHFGIAAIVAMLHDILIVISTFSLLGFLYGVEIDGLFLTAILTVIGFSINDTIVVYDRIRENLIKGGEDSDFIQIANHSIYETLNRSFITSFVVIFIMFALFLLGGESIRYFSLALVIGIFAGTYSSIFIATPFLIFLNKKFAKLN